MAADKSKGQALQDWIAKSVPRLLQKRGGCEKCHFDEQCPIFGRLAEVFLLTFSDTVHTISGGKGLLKDRMPTASAVVRRGGETLPVVVVKNEMFTFVSNDVGNASEIRSVLCD